MIEQMRREYPLWMLCRVLGVSASGFHARRSRGPSRRAQEEPRLEIEIRAAHQRTRQTYGPERLQRELAAHGERDGVHRIKRVRRQLGLRCKQRRKFKVTTDSRHSLPMAENLLEQRFEAAAPCQAWLSDIAYVPTDEGWLYLVGHKDLCTRKIVGYAMGERMTKHRVLESLLRAVEVTKPPKGLLHHSDKGSPYGSYEYRRMLEGLGINASMSGTGNGFDNAPWKASGQRGRRSGSFIDVSSPDSRLYGKLLSTLTCSTIDSGFKSNWTISHRQPLNVGTTNNAWQHDRLGAHYGRPIPDMSEPWWVASHERRWAGHVGFGVHR